MPQYNRDTTVRNIDLGDDTVSTYKAPMSLDRNAHFEFDIYALSLKGY